MGRNVWALVAFVLLFCAPALCQYNLQFSPSLGQTQNVGTTVVYTVSSYPGLYDVSLSFDPSTDYTVTPSLLVLNSSVPSLTFSFYPKTAGSELISITLNGTDSTYYNSPNAYKYISLRNLDLSKGYSYFPPQTNPVLAVLTNPFAVALTALPNNDVTVNVGSDPAGAIAFAPNSFSFTPATVNPIPFTIQAATTGKNGVVTAYFTFSGTDGAWYYPQNFSIYPVTRKIVPSAAYTTVAPVKPGQQSQDIRISLQYPPPTSVTLTPYSDDLTFSPPSLEYTAATDSVQFSFVAATAGAQVISWTLSGPDAALYTDLPNKTISIGTRPFDVTAPPTSTYTAGGQSGVFTIATQYPPATSVTINLTVTATCTPASVVPTVSPSILTFTPDTLSNTFVISSNFVCSGVTLSASLSGPDQDLYDVPYLASIYLYFNKLSLATFVNTNPAWSGVLQCGDTTGFTQTVRSPPPNGFAATLSAPGAAFVPTELDFSATVLTQAFTVTATYYQPSITVHYTVSGADVPLIATIQDMSISVARKIATTPAGNLFVTPSTNTLFAVSTSAPVEIKLNYPPASGLTVTPTATGLTFDPVAITFGSTDTSKWFTVTAPADGTYTVTYTISGADAGCFSLSTTTTSITAYKETILLNPGYFPQLTVGTVSVPYTISVLNLANDITITPTAQDSNGNPLPAGLYTFNPPSFDLTPASPSAGFTYTISTSRPGNDYIVFQVSGDGADAVTPLKVYVSSTLQRQFKTPTYLYSFSPASGFNPATFVQGIASPSFTVTVTDIPLNGVSLTPFEPNTIFNPPVLNFDANTLSASFTLTPQTGAATPGLAKTITWTVGGTDAAIYATPAVNSYLAIKRDIKVSQVSNLAGNYVYVNTPITFTIVTPYPPSSTLTITLSAGSEITLPVTTLTIDSTTTTATFTATPTVKGYGFPIHFVITGDEASEYVQIPDINLYTQQSTFTVTLPVGATNPVTLVYGEDSYVFNVRAQAPPTSSVTVSIYSSQAKINPPSYEFKPGYESYDFALQPILSAFPAGTSASVALTFVLSGPDAATYNTPGDSTFTATVSNPLRQITVSPQTYIYLTNGATAFTISSTVPAASQVTITPTTPTDGEFLFTPTSVTLTSTQTTATLTVTRTSTTLPKSTFVPIVFGVSGSDAYLYADPGITYVYAIADSFSINTLTGTTAFVVNQPKTFPITFASPAADAFTIIPKVVAGQPLTFTPPTITINKGDIASTFTITPAGAGTARIAFFTQGPGAASISPKDDVDITIAPGTITFNNIYFSFNVGGQVRTGTVTLNTPALNGLTLTFNNAPGLIITPSVISFAPGAVSAPISANITTSGISGYYTTSLGGPDAGLFTNPYPNPSSYSYSSAAPSVTAAATSSSNTYLQQVVYFYLGTASQVLPLTITPSGAGLTFVPASISIYDSTTTSVSVNVYASTAGSSNIYYTLSGPGAAFFTVPSLYAAPVVVNFYAYPFSVYNTYSGNTAIVGTASTQYVISVPAPASTAPTVWITPSANAPGIDFIPPVLFINSTTPTTTFSWRSNLTVGNFIVSFALSGPGASAYLQIAPFTITVSPVSFSLPNFENYIVTPAGAPFVAGVPSPNYCIWARAVPAPVTIHLVSDQLEITPNVITLTTTDQQAYFSFVPRKVGPATIEYLLLGNNTALYVTPAPTTGLLVNYRVYFPVIPTLAVGQTSPALTVKISPPPITTFVLSIAGSTTIIFSPSRLVYTPAITNQQFTVTALSPTIYRPTFNAPGTSPSGSTGSFVVSLTGTDGIDGQARTVALLPPSAVMVTPGTFTVLHPRYQLDVKTSISITISTPPRSDVIITLLANNINFVNAPYAIFTKDGPTTQELDVIPRHTTSYELDYASFRVDYLLTGTNVNDYFAPSETLHYIALPMGYIAAIILVPLAVIIIIIIVIVVVRRKKPSSTS